MVSPLLNAFGDATVPPLEIVELKELYHHQAALVSGNQIAGTSKKWFPCFGCKMLFKIQNMFVNCIYMQLAELIQSRFGSSHP